MVLLAKLLLPDRDRNGKQNKTPIAQLPVAACLKWLNPRRAAAGLPIYADGVDSVKTIPVPSVERLRSEIIDAVQNNTFAQNVIEEPLHANVNRYTDTISITMKKLTLDKMIPYTDIWTACYYGRQHEVEHYVLACGIDVNIAQFGHPYQTPLHYAASGGAIICAKFLLSRGASPCVTDVNGNSPIHMAARWGRVDILEEFLRGASVNEIFWSSLNRMGQTPRELSIKHGHKDTTAFFELHFPTITENLEMKK